MTRAASRSVLPTATILKRSPRGRMVLECPQRKPILCVTRTREFYQGTPK